MSILFICGVGLYFVLMALIGQLASRRISTLEDYLIAGRQLPFFLAVPTIVATWFGAGSSMGVSGTVYSQGLYGVIPDPFGCSLALLLTGLFFAIPLRRLRVLTIADVLSKSYSSSFEQVSTWMVPPFYIGTLASQMLAMGYIFHVISGSSIALGIILGGCIVVTYTVTGGMWAVTLTDFIQFALLSVGLILLIPLCLNSIQDRQVFFNQVVEEFNTLLPTNPSSPNWLSYSGRLLMTGLGAIMGQDLIQRVLASRSESVARYSCLCGGVLYLLLGLIPIFIGLAGRMIYPHLDQPELLIPLLAKQFLSPVLFTIFACGLFAAIMSTADSYLLAGTSLMAHNLLLKKWPTSNERTKIKYVRLTSLVLACLAMGLAFTGQSIFDLMVHSGALLFVALFVPTSAALFLRKVSSLSAWSSMLGGITAWIGFIAYHFSGDLNREDLLFSAATCGAVSSLLFYVTTHLILPFIQKKEGQEIKAKSF